MNFEKLISKQSAAETPLLLKIAIILQFWFLLGGLSHVMQKNDYAGMLNALIGIAIQSFALIAVWNLRKWGAIVIAIMIALSSLLGYASMPLAYRGILIGFLLRMVLLAPVLIYWKRMN